MSPRSDGEASPTTSRDENIEWLHRFTGFQKGDEQIPTYVPEGLLRGIEDAYEGRTGGIEDIEAVLKF